MILLVNKGTEGLESARACSPARWPAGCGRRTISSCRPRTRCLRQVPGNTAKARVYLSTDNYGILDRQLQETYGESIAELNRRGQETRRAQDRAAQARHSAVGGDAARATVVKKDAAAARWR